VLREPDLPVAQHDSVSRELQLLIERRETLVEQRTATVNRVQWRIHELDPVRSNNLKPLIYAKHRDPVAAWLAKQAGLVAELAFDELDDIARLTQLINALEKRIAERVRVHAGHLLALPGCGELTAAKIIAETANVTRFKSEAAFARYLGVAPRRTLRVPPMVVCASRGQATGSSTLRSIASRSPKSAWAARAEAITTSAA
jgi:transposase